MLQNKINVARNKMDLCGILRYKDLKTPTEIIFDNMKFKKLSHNSYEIYILQGILNVLVVISLHIQ